MDPHGVLEPNLRDAGVQEEQEEAGGEGHSEPRAENAPPSRGPTPLLVLSQREALVAITATASAMVRCSGALLLLVRRLIVAHCVEGYGLEFGYRLRIYPVRQGWSHTLQQRHWQEETMSELLRSQGAVTLDPSVLAKIRASFGTTSHTLRFVCATEPGPRIPCMDVDSLTQPCPYGPPRSLTAPDAPGAPGPCDLPSVPGQRGSAPRQSPWSPRTCNGPWHIWVRL